MIFSGTEYIFKITQAFANPTDLASSRCMGKCFPFSVKEDGSLSTSIYRKPTHTNQYLQWDSHHSIANKFSVINSLIHRANNICSNQEQQKEELTHIEKALTTCKYPSWAIQRVKLKKKIQKPTKDRNTNHSNITNRSSITVPYNQGLSESYKKHWKEVWHPSTF